MKRAFDIVVATLMLSVVLVPLAVLIVVIRLTSKGDGMFIHTRIGKNGKPFSMYKLRTMTTDTEHLIFDLADTSSPLFKVHNDPRVTPLGRYLRKTSIDELPQLVNVIKGDMSLVGPRPQVAEEVALYDTYHAGRLAVRPGLTGLWQISGRSDLDFEEAIGLDLRYVEQHNVWLDIKIMFKTIAVLTKGAY